MSLGAGCSRRTLARVSIAFAVVGCGQGPEVHGLERQQIVRGFASPADQDAVVLVRRTGINWWCSGAVVAPTLVLSARSCVFDLLSSTDSDFYIRCLPSKTKTPILQALDPTEFEIGVGTGSRKVEARGRRFYAGDELDLCANDLVLIEVDAPLSPPPLALRLDSQPKLHEQGRLIGWGFSEEQPVTLRKDRQQREMEVLAVGPTDFPVPDAGQFNVNEGSFISGEGGCFIDQGGPFISDETNAIIGILSAIEPADPNATLEDGVSYCIGAHAVFRSPASQSTWIREAFARSNQVPWLEGHPPLASLGQSCESSADCSSGVCKTTTGGNQFCSQDCSSRACPDGLQCLGPQGERWCAPARIVSSDSASARCTLVQTPSRARTSPECWLMFALVLLHRFRKFLGKKIYKPFTFENAT